MRGRIGPRRAPRVAATLRAMRKVWVVVVSALCAVTLIRGYDNAQNPHPVDDVAQAIVCGELGVCGGDDASWSAVETSPFQRTYRLDAGRGAVEVRCRWSAVLWGSVSCKADREAVPEIVPPTPEQRPHAIKRSADAM